MKRILVLEDDKKIAEALVTRLQAAGYVVQHEAFGLAGLKRAAHEPPDLILLDVWLPDGASFNVVERLAERGLTGVPFIFMTASRKPNLWRMAQEAGAAGFFEKPYDPEKLLAAIAQALTCAPTPYHQEPSVLPALRAA
jgi:DNA-binding response OmpR family regulator